MTPASPQHILGADLSALAAAFRRDGYTDASCEEVQSLTRALGLPPPQVTLSALNAPPALRTHTALWALGLPVPEVELAPLLGPPLLERLITLGILNRGAGAIRAEFSVIPSDGLLTTRDFDAVITGKPAGDDYVLGIGPSTRRLAALMVPTPGGLTLDLGTGQGFLAITASQWSSRVIATDVNRRALSAAAFSANISGRTNIEFREGSYFEPVADLRGRCNLILCNPPFVIQPSGDRVCFTGTERGDRCIQHLVEEGPAYLAPGGWLSVLGNWTHTDESDWADTPMQWAKGRQCDVWIIRRQSWSPRAYAQSWIDELTRNGASADRPPVLDEWLAYYESLGIRRITMGAVVMHRREGKNWARFDTLFSDSAGDAGPQAAQLFENQTTLNDLSPELLLHRAIVPVRGLEIDLRHRFGEQGFAPASITLRNTTGFPMPLSVQLGALEVVRRLDGARSLAQIASEVAQAHGGDPASLAPGIASLGMELLRLGHARLAD
ncbi:MAG: methyltransferase [Phycisphaerales bacterium]